MAGQALVSLPQLPFSQKYQLPDRAGESTSLQTTPQYKQTTQYQKHFSEAGEERRKRRKDSCGPVPAKDRDGWAERAAVRVWAGLGWYLLVVDRGWLVISLVVLVSVVLCVRCSLSCSFIVS